MERTYLEPAGIAPPPEPYSHAIRCGDTLYIAGQVAFDEDNQVVGIGDPRAQAERVWHNIRLAVEAAGGTLADVVKITVFLKDVRHAPPRSACEKGSSSRASTRSARSCRSRTSGCRTCSWKSTRSRSSPRAGRRSWRASPDWRRS